LEHEKARPFLTPDLRDRLWPYLASIAKRNQMKAFPVGGSTDHVHILIALRPTLSIAKAGQLLKGNSSKSIHQTFPKMRSFEWQQGYGAFSIAISGAAATVAYIRKQAEHHRTPAFREEFEIMLRKHGLNYDEELKSGRAIATDLIQDAA
jgi:putative transposase